MEKLEGTVYLVGAGPGDPGLLTLRAARLLRRAEVVLHDALVGERILRMIRPGAARIDVGKRGGGRHTPQPEIQRLLVEAAGRARTVVRLKGGDPFLFGRGGEEALALAAAGVRVRVVPGVTAALGAAAAAGIPLTHRGASRAVTLVTGHECAGGEPGGVDWEVLAAAGHTLVVYMGLHELGRLAERLVRGGRAGGTPAAVVASATLPEERVVEAPLAEIAARARAAGIESPAVVIVGEAVGVRAELRRLRRAGAVHA